MTETQAKAIVFGRKPDGTLNICKATPEHRGKGSCKHEEHMDIDNVPPSQVKEIMREAEERSLKNLHKEVPVIKKEKKKRPSTNIDHDVLMKQAKHVMHNELSKNRNYYADFHEKYAELTEGLETGESYAPIVHEFLKSDDPLAKRIRNDLHPGIDLEYFSELLAKGPAAMRKPSAYTRDKKYSVARFVMTRLNNDMDRNNYMNTVLFFGGACSYCGKALSKERYRKNATGEHFTPVTPNGVKDPRGSTTYGNMALACEHCNSTRSSLKIEAFIKRTETIKVKNKGKSLGKIHAFQKFAKHKDYNNDQMFHINKVIAELEKLESELAAEMGDEFRNGGHLKIRQEAFIKIQELNDSLYKY